MLNNPDEFIEVFCEAGADLITVHQETTVHLNRTIKKDKAIRGKGWGSIKSSYTH